MRQLVNSFNDLSGKIGTVALLMFERIVLIVFGHFTLIGLITLGQNVFYLNNPNNQNVIFFNEIENNGKTQIDSENVIKKVIDEGIGYILINYSGDPNVYVVGNCDLALDDVSYDLPFAVYGSNIKNKVTGDMLVTGDYARIEIPIVEIDQNAVFFAGHKIDLSDRILIAMEYDDFVRNFYHGDLVNYLHVVNPSKEQMQWIMNDLNPDGIRVLADSVKNYRSTSFKDMLGGGVIYFMLISLCTVFLCFHIFSCEVEMIDSKIKEYYVHRIYGCGKVSIFMRIFFTLIQISMVPIIFILLFAGSLVPKDTGLMFIYAAMITVFYIIISKCFADYIDKKIQS